MAKKPTSKTTTRAAAPRKAATTTRAQRAEPEGEHTHLATPAEEDAAREAATKPAAVKKALADGKKDPIAKFGDPDADPVATAARRAAFG